MRRSMVRACWMAKLWLWDAEVTSRIPAAQIGSMRMITLTSSVRCTVDSCRAVGHRCSPSVTVAPTTHVYGIRSSQLSNRVYSSFHICSGRERSRNRSRRAEIGGGGVKTGRNRAIISD
jgi:hypothetical protein